MADQDTESRRAADDLERAVHTADQAQPGNEDIDEAKRVAAAVAAAIPPASTALQAQQPAQMARSRELNPLWSMTVAASMKLQDMTMNALYGLARQFAASDLVPERLQGKPDNVFMVLLKGAEIDVTASTALAEIMIVEGKITISSHLQNALVQRSGKMKIWRIIESTEEQAVMEVQRHDWADSVKIGFTWDEAKKLGLGSRGKNPAYSPWNTQRANMLRRRAVTRAAREFAGDVVIAYDPEEMERDDDTVQSAPAWGKVITDAAATTKQDDSPPDEQPRVERDADQGPTDDGPPLDARLRKSFDAAIQAFATAPDQKALREQVPLMEPLQRAAEKGDRAAEGALSEARQIYNARHTKLKNAGATGGAK